MRASTKADAPTGAATILVVEDDPAVMEQIRDYFASQGYAVATASDARACEEVLARQHVDLCLMDINLPGEDGLSIIHRIRKTSSVGIIVVSGNADLVDRVVGLESGADDYVTKPVELRELLSRVKNVLRRTRQQPAARPTEAWTFEGWTFNNDEQVLVSPAAHRLRLSSGECRLLTALIRGDGQRLTRAELTRVVCNREWQPEDRYIDVMVVKLRKKFGAAKGDSSFIATVHGTGYRFQPPVVALRAPAR